MLLLQHVQHGRSFFMIDVLDLLKSDGSIVVNKKLAHLIGLEEAIVYAELVSKFKYWSSRGETIDWDEDGKEIPGNWFYCTIEDLTEATTLKKDRQNRAIRNLEDKWKLIKTTRKGLPAKRYFFITDAILDLIEFKISQNPQTGMQELRNPDFAKSAGNNTKLNNTNYDYDDDEEYITNRVSKENLTIFQEAFIDTAKKHGVPDRYILKTVDLLKNKAFNVQAFERGIQIALDNYAQGKVSHFPHYVLACIEDQQDQQMVQASKEIDRNNRQKKSIPFFNWLDYETN